MPNRQLTVGVLGWVAGAGSIFFFCVCLAWPGTDHRPAADTIDHTIQGREGEMSGRGGAGEVWCLFITMVTNGTINHSTPPQLSSHPQSERQSLGPGLLEQHDH